MRLYHWTRPESVESIRRNGFKPSRYNAFGDGFDGCRGVYVCTNPKAHQRVGDVALSIEVPDTLLPTDCRQDCHSGTDWMLPVDLANRFLIPSHRPAE